MFDEVRQGGHVDQPAWPTAVLLVAQPLVEACLQAATNDDRWFRDPEVEAIGASAAATGAGVAPADACPQLQEASTIRFGTEFVFAHRQLAQLVQFVGGAPAAESSRRARPSSVASSNRMVGSAGRSCLPAS